MPAITESSPPAARGNWLDRWFEPRWRALLTWLAVAALVGLALDLGVGLAIRKLLDPFFNHLDAMLPGTLPPGTRGIAIMTNLFALMFWIEPVALRLNLPRGVAWVVVRNASFIAAVGFAGINRMTWMNAIMAASVVAALLLRGWRTRPAMPLLAGILFCLILPTSERSIHLGMFWVWTITISLPYAVLLLYGTRRLPREA